MHADVFISVSLRSSADVESLPALVAQVAEHQKKLAAIPDHVKVSHSGLCCSSYLGNSAGGKISAVNFKMGEEQIIRVTDSSS